MNRIFFIFCLFLIITMTCHSQSSKDIDQWVKDTKDKYVLVRVKAVGSLGGVTTEQSIQTLITVMREDEEFYLREKAAKSLINIGLPCIDSMIPILNDKNEELRNLALWVLQSTTDQKIGMDSKKWQSWWKKNKKKLLEEAAKEEKK